jgi:hypothetical protein
MIVGREMIVGAGHGGHDYDELMEHATAGESARYQDEHERAHQPPYVQHHPQHPQQQQHQMYAPQYERPRPPPYPQPGHHAEGPRVVREHPQHARQFPIGFTKSGIAPGTATDIEVKPQVLFRGERLAVAPSIARYFDVIDIKVGKDSQLAATGEMPAESFSALAVGVRLELDTASPGITLTITVRNIDTTAQDFKAVLYGTVLE